MHPPADLHIQLSSLVAVAHPLHTHHTHSNCLLPWMRIHLISQGNSDGLSCM
jgi:hypothetical protein